MSKIKSIKFIKSELFVKYNRLLKGESYVLIFSKTDGYFLYNELEAIGLEFTHEHRQKVWDEVKITSQIWYKGDNEEPNNQQGMAEAKHRIFKNWIENHARAKSDINAVIAELIKE